MQERVGETRELGFLHGSGVGRRDDVDGGQQIRPWRRMPEHTFTEGAFACDTFLFGMIISYVDDLMPAVCGKSAEHTVIYFLKSEPGYLTSKEKNTTGCDVTEK